MMRNKTLLELLVFSIAMSAGASLYASRKKEQQAKELFIRASQLSNIEAKDSPPFVLDATVKAYPDAKTILDGHYHLLWKTAKTWRREMSFPGYHAMMVQNGDKVWHVSNLLYKPYLVFQTFKAIGFYKRLQIPVGGKIGAIEVQKISGTSLSCVDEKTKEKGRGEFCFDPARGYLLQETNVAWHTHDEYSNYVVTEHKAFPQRLRAIQDGATIVQIDVRNLIFNPKIDSALFSPPAGPNFHETTPCEGKKITRAKPVYAPSPRYPESASGALGDVVFYADIGTDGRIRGLTLLQSAGPAVLDQAAAQTINQWRLRPEVCGGVPVDMPIFIQASFK